MSTLISKLEVLRPQSFLLFSLALSVQDRNGFIHYLSDSFELARQSGTAKVGMRGFHLKDGFSRC